MKVLSALHDSIPVRFGHLQEKIMRVGRTIYVADLRSFSSTVDIILADFSNTTSKQEQT
tara:strand:- start:57 stop:233 length:177 start_codon:yes stop_codon:yes gene_type:complete